MGYNQVAQEPLPFFVTEMSLHEARDKLLTKKHLVAFGTGHDKCKVANSRAGRLAMADGGW